MLPCSRVSFLTKNGIISLDTHLSHHTWLQRPLVSSKIKSSFKERFATTGDSQRMSCRLQRQFQWIHSKNTEAMEHYQERCMYFPNDNLKRTRVLLNVSFGLPIVINSILIIEFNSQSCTERLTSCSHFLLKCYIFFSSPPLYCHFNCLLRKKYQIWFK